MNTILNFIGAMHSQTMCAMSPEHAVLHAQARDRKLRIFPGPEHPFGDHPRLVAWEPKPRQLRVKGALFQLPEGYEPMNPEAYIKRFGHRMDRPLPGGQTPPPSKK